MEKKTIGLVEKISIVCKEARKDVLAKFDTGAKENSIDKAVARELGLRIVKRARVKSTLGKESREVAEIVFEIGGIKFNSKATLSDRSKMAYPVLIGRNIIHGNFIIDTEKSNKSSEEKDLRVAE